MSVIATVEHVQEAKRRHGGYCARGMALWFERYGMTLREFLRNGYPAERLEETGDPLGQKVAEIAREAAQKGGA